MRDRSKKRKEDGRDKEGVAKDEEEEEEGKL